MRAQKPVNDGSMDNITAFETVIHAQNALAPLVLAKCLRASLLKTYVRPAIVCVGSDRVAGDSLGPLTGSILQKCGADAFLYGTLGRTVTAREVPALASFLQKTHPKSPVLAIDAAVGSAEEVGLVKLWVRRFIPARARTSSSDAWGMRASSALWRGGRKALRRSTGCGSERSAAWRRSSRRRSFSHWKTGRDLQRGACGEAEHVRTSHFV